MRQILPALNRRAVLLSGAAFLVGLHPALSTGEQVMTIHKEATCGCCTEWVNHVQKAGFSTRALEVQDLRAVKQRLGVPPDLTACHTAEVGGYLVEGHIPAEAIKRLLSEKPSASGIAVPGMPVGSPGMEGGRPEIYEVVLFGPNMRRTYMRFIGDRAV